MPATVTFKNMSPSDHAFEALGIAVLTVSDSRTPATDRSGRLLVERLQAAGHRLVEAALLPDDRYQVRAQVAQLVCASGGQRGVAHRRHRHDRP